MIPTKYRKMSSSQMTPKGGERKRWAGVPVADAVRLEQLDPSLRAELSTASYGSCSQRYGWAICETSLAVWEMSGKPNLRKVIQLCALGIRKNEDIKVYFPWQNTVGVPPTCVVVSLSTDICVLVSLDDGSCSPLLGDEGPTDFTAAVCLDEKGIAVGTATGSVWVLLADPTCSRWLSPTRLDSSKEKGYLHTVLSTFSGIPFFRKGNTSTEPTQVPVSTLLYLPTPAGKDTLFMVLANGRVIQYHELSANADYRVLLEDYTEVYDRPNLTYTTVVGCLNFSSETEFAGPTINILVSVSGDTEHPQLSLCRIVAPLDVLSESSLNPVTKSPIYSLGSYVGRLSIFVTDADNSSDETLLLVASTSDRTQLVKITLPRDSAYASAEGSEETPAPTATIVPGAVIASSDSAFPYPESLIMVSRDGWFSEGITSRKSLMVRNLLKSNGNETVFDSGITGDLIARSNDIIAEAVLDHGQWQVLDDSSDRQSGILLRRVLDKRSRHDVIVETAKRVEPEKLKAIADNSERLALIVSLREVQNELYSDTSDRWQPTEVLCLLTDFSKTFGIVSGKYADLMLTPLQRVYTEVYNADLFLPFLSDWCTDAAPTGGKCIQISRLDPQYLMLIARIVGAGLTAIYNARLQSQYDGPRWTHASRIIDSLYSIAESLATGIQRSTDDGITRSLQQVLKLVVSFAIVQEKEAGVAPRIEPNTWVQNMFVESSDKNPENPTKSTGYTYAKEIARELRDYCMLTELALMLPEEARLAELREVLQQSPYELFHALITVFWKANNISELLKMPSALQLDSESATAFAKVANEIIPSNFPLKYSLRGPTLTESTPTEASDSLMRVGEAMLGLDGTSAHILPNTSDRLHKLKIAKFALSVATHPAKEEVLDSISRSTMIVQIQREVLKMGDRPVMQVDELLQEVLSRSAEEDKLDQDGYCGTLAWAFPLGKIQDQSGSSCVTEIWLKTLSFPELWWQQHPYNQLPDLPEPEQLDLVVGTKFFAVYKMVVAYPQIAAAAFTNGRQGFFDQMSEQLPDGLPVQYFSLLIEYSDLAIQRQTS
eukprot:TRINITY_DN5073_c1_g1_i1.p1 TRINITY_DN5073_c1_g1~~TRINITY_DN5073_c1_g1_i1.p1  ORF type:complete len:1069 (+),score=204.27 TRINITY_DN5073_c1_g1_i1:32-3208(+)